MTSRELYDMLFTEEDRLTDQYDCLPESTRDIGISVRADAPMSESMVDYNRAGIYLSPEVTLRNDEEVMEILAHGVKHLKWHPNQGLGFRTDRYDRRTFTGADDVEDMSPEVLGEEAEADVRGTVDRIYREAVDAFKITHETDFSAPRLVTDNSVVEEDISEVEHPETLDQVGYFIDHRNDQIVLNSEILGEMKPELLNQDMQYMLKRYHDLALEQKVREDVIPYVEQLGPEAELNVENVVFRDLEDATASYNPEKQCMNVDYSRLKDFDPETGEFRSGFRGLPGAAVLLHEEVHDRDFSVNPDSRTYLDALPNVERSDPRNAVLEAPTTFEVMMAGWETRPYALQAFKNPVENISFFRSYPAEGGEDPDSNELIYPYNMGLFTALSIHEEMIEQEGLEEGTRTTRDILYGNDWDLEQMQNVLERSFDGRDVPNVPRHRRNAVEAVENGRVDEEASEILEILEEADEQEAFNEATVRGNELVHEYKERHSNTGPATTIWELHRKLEE